jgi:hypothetical protein
MTSISEPTNVPIEKFPCRACGEKFWFSDDEDPICEDCEEKEDLIYENTEYNEEWDEEGRVIDYPSDEEGTESYWPTQFAEDV